MTIPQPNLKLARKFNFTELVKSNYQSESGEAM